MEVIAKKQLRRPAACVVLRTFGWTFSTPQISTVLRKMDFLNSHVC
jgi:hypothetical protein